MIPKKVRIGYLDYKIEEYQDDEFEGDYSPQSQRIRIRTLGRSSAFIANTLLHEVMHGVYYHSSLKSPNSSDSDTETEENVVNGMSNMLSQVFRDNPDLIRYLLKTLK